MAQEVEGRKVSPGTHRTAESRQLLSLGLGLPMEANLLVNQPDCRVGGPEALPSPGNAASQKREPANSLVNWTVPHSRLLEYSSLLCGFGPVTLPLWASMPIL